MNFSFVVSKIIMATEWLVALETIVLGFKPEFDVGRKVIHPLDQNVVVNAFAIDRIMWCDRLQTIIASRSKNFHNKVYGDKLHAGS